MRSLFMLWICLCLLVCPWGLTSLSWAAYYSWVDDQGVLHVTNVPSAKLRQAELASKAGFGGHTPVLIEFPTGKKRKLYPVDVSRYDRIIRRAAEHYRLPFAFVKSVIKVESNFNPKAVSRAKAKGLMQLMDATAKDMSVSNSFDPEQNIFGGTRYLRLMANQFEGDIEKTAAAYNAGPKTVRLAGGIPNIRETRRYVARVKQMFEHYKELEVMK